MNLFIGIKRHSTIGVEGRERRRNLSKLVSLIAVDVVEKLECMQFMPRAAAAISTSVLIPFAARMDVFKCCPRARASVFSAAAFQ